MLAGVRITIDRCPEGRFELAQARPAADLAGAVVRYAGYVERTAWSLRQREVATTIVPLIINLGAGLPGPARRRRPPARCIGASSPGSTTAMPTSPRSGRRTACRSTSRRSAPGASSACRCASSPAARSISRWSPAAAPTSLAERLYHAAGWARPAAAARRLRAPPAGGRPAALGRGRCAPGSGWSRAAGGCGSSALAREIGWSRKQQAVRFAAEIGAPPKTVARILRFRAGAPGDPRRAPAGTTGPASRSIAAMPTRPI